MASNTSSLPMRTKVFISYSHKDSEWLRRLQVHLKPLEDNEVEIWDDTKIRPGSDWQEEIKRAIDSAKVAVLLISADFLASDFIKTNELPLLLSAAQKDGAIILPIILSPSRFLKNKDISKFQAVNDPSTPLINMSKGEQEAVLVKVTEAIEHSLNHPFGTSHQIQRRAISSNNEPNALQNNAPLSVSATEANLEANKKNRFLRINPTIWVAIISGIVALITAYWQFIYKPNQSISNDTIQYAGRVIDANTQKVISGAKVSVEAQTIPQILYTDSEGIFYFKTRTSTDTARIRVEANNYEVFDRNISLTKTGLEDVRLIQIKSAPNPTPTSVPSIVNSGKTSTQQKQLTTTNRRKTAKPPPCTAEDRLLGKC